jgi:hypothetical protein
MLFFNIFPPATKKYYFCTTNERYAADCHFYALHVGNICKVEALTISLLRIKKIVR